MPQTEKTELTNTSPEPMHCQPRGRVLSGAMSIHVAVPQQKRKRGNPEWGKPLQPLPALLTQFEVEVARLGLTRSEYSTSLALKRWCAHNRNRVYVPEWLLDEWEMYVEIGYGFVSGG